MDLFVNLFSGRKAGLDITYDKEQRCINILLSNSLPYSKPFRIEIANVDESVMNENSVISNVHFHFVNDFYYVFVKDGEYSAKTVDMFLIILPISSEQNDCMIMTQHRQLARVKELDVFKVYSCKGKNASSMVQRLAYIFTLNFGNATQLNFALYDEKRVEVYSLIKKVRGRKTLLENPWLEPMYIRADTYPLTRLIGYSACITKELENE